MIYDIVIRNGTLVTSAGVIRADLGINSERIAAIGPNLRGAEAIDAAGKLVIPGAIDPHVHLQMPAGALTSSDDWFTGTVAAACGGTTTVIDFVEPEPAPASPLPFDGLRSGSAEVGPLLSALAARRAEAEGRAVVDFGLHMTLLDASPGTLAEIPAVLAAGCTSFKTYLTYDGFKLSDAEFLSVLEAVAAAGGIALVHAENDAAIAYLKAKLLAAGHTEPRWHPSSRPAGTEGEAVERALSLAEVAGCPLYVVHVSTARGAQAVARARGRGQAAFGETCPPYLLLTDIEYNRPGFEGAKFVCSPPLRTPEDNASLWAHLATDALSTVGTDHCPFFFAGQKDLGQRDGAYPPFNRIAGGMPGIESRLALLYTFGVGQGRLSLERWAEVCCTAPARVFGLAGRKGALTLGADADVVIFDPEREATVRRATLHENCDYTPFDGFHLRGYPVLTLLRGRVIARDGEFLGGPGGGQFLRRAGG